MKHLNDKPWFIAALLSWGIAFFEYSVHIPANRNGSSVLSLAQLQLLQIGMSLLIFIPFAIIVMGQPVKSDYLWASLCLGCCNFCVQIMINDYLDQGHRGLDYVWDGDGNNKSVSELFGEADRRIPSEDSVVVARVVGAYPDCLWQVAADELENFSDSVVKHQNEQDYRQLDAVEYGLLDYSRLENR